MKIFNLIEATSISEVLIRIVYFLKKKSGYYKRKKRPICHKNLSNLHLINKDYLSNIDTNIKTFYYNFLSKEIDINNLQFPKAKKIWTDIKIEKWQDVKNIWEINRLQFLFPLAINYYQSKNQKILNLINNLINKWILANYYNYGINWYSNLEVAIRAISLYLTFELTNIDVKQILYEHGSHLYEEINFSKYAIKNNHVFGEAVALLLLGKAFTNKKWIMKAKKIINQFHYLLNDEGISIEASFSYHFFLTQMFIFLSSLKENKFNKKVEKAINFINAIIKPNGKIVNFGDNDEGFFYNPFWKKNILKIIKNINILNHNLKISFSEKKFYNYCDYKIYKDKEKGFFLLFNGQREKYHSHSDNLSIELTIDSINLLEDAGTFVYNGNPAKRCYFRSSLAHNTISFEGFDHSVQVKTFRWIKSKKSTLKVNNNILTGILKCNHSQAKRTIKIKAKEIIIIDELKTSKRTYINFHLGVNLNVVKINANTYKVNKFYFSFTGFKKIIILNSLISNRYNHYQKRANIRIETFGNTRLETKIYEKDG